MGDKNMSLENDYWNGKQQPLFSEGSMAKSQLDLPIDENYLKQQRELGKMYEKSALETIRRGEPVGDISIKYITTPEVTDETYTIIRKSNGEIFKRYLEGDKFIKFLSKLVSNNLDPNADITSKLINGTSFYAKCNDIKSSLEERLDNGQPLGFHWTLSGDYVNSTKIMNKGKEEIRIYTDLPVSLTEQQACTIINLINEATRTAVQPEIYNERRDETNYYLPQD